MTGTEDDKQFVRPRTEILGKIRNLEKCSVDTTRSDRERCVCLDQIKALRWAITSDNDLLKDG